MLSGIVINFKDLLIRALNLMMMPVAKDVLIFMAVAFNDSCKLRVGYFSLQALVL